MTGYKQEALNLLEQLHNVELQRDQLLEETKNVLTPAEEREKLLKQIKDNNQEITSFEKQMNELKEANETMKVELEEKPVEEDNPEVDNQEKSEFFIS